MICRVADNTLN